MTYRTELTRDAAKALRAIPKKDQIRIGKKIDSLAASLPNPSETKLKGDNPFHRVRVGNFDMLWKFFYFPSTLTFNKKPFIII